MSGIKGMGTYNKRFDAHCPRCDELHSTENMECKNCGKGHIRVFNTSSNGVKSYIYGCDYCEKPLFPGFFCRKCNAQITAKFVNAATCFVATAAFQDSNHPRVHDLRLFRDEILKNYKFGRHFINWYYRNGPKMALIVEAIPALRIMAVAILTPLSYILGGVSRQR